MQVARDVEVELWPDEDDGEGIDSRPNVVGPFSRQPQAQSVSRWVAGLGFGQSGQTPYFAQSCFA